MGMNLVFQQFVDVSRDFQKIVKSGKNVTKFG